MSETGMSRRSSRATPSEEEEAVGEQGGEEASRVLAAVEALTAQVTALSATVQGQQRDQSSLAYSTVSPRPTAISA